MMSDSDRLFDIDDGMDGVDDFISEPNPFEEHANTSHNKYGSGTGDNIMGDESGKTVNDLPSAYDNTISLEPQRVAPDRDGSIPQGKLPPGLLNYYSRYFQLSNEGLKKRIMHPRSFYQDSRDPEEQNFEIDDEDEDEASVLSDLYGPVWITATAVMAKFVVVTLVEIVKDGLVLGVPRQAAEDGSYLPSTFWEKQFVNLIHSIWLYYAHTFISPLLIYRGFQNHYDGMKMKSRYELISIYGYSNLIWVSISVILGVLEGFSQPVARSTKWLEFIIFGLGLIPVFFYILRESMYRIQNKVVPTSELFKEIYKVPFVVVLFLLIVFWLIYGILILI